MKVDEVETGSDRVPALPIEIIDGIARTISFDLQSGLCYRMRMFSDGVVGAESAVPVALDQLSDAAASAEGPCVGGGAYVDGVSSMKPRWRSGRASSRR